MSMWAYRARCGVCAKSSTCIHMCEMSPAYVVCYLCVYFLPSSLCDSGMKAGRVRVMNGRGQEVGIDLDSSAVVDASGGVPPGAEFPPEGLHHQHSSRSHSRSQSWSFNSRGQRPGPGDLTSSLAALNPITSVIREIVPSFGEEESDSSSGASPTLMSRATSQVSLTSGIRFGDGLVRGTTAPSVPHSPLPHRTSAGGRGTEGGGTRGERGAEGNGNEDQNIGFEISDGVRWLEHNAIFIILLLLKFAWYHRSGLDSSYDFACSIYIW